MVCRSNSDMRVGEVIHEQGVVWLKGFLDADEQVAFYDEVCRFYNDRGPKQHGDIEQLLKKTRHQGRYLLGFESSPEFIPGERFLASTAHKEVHAAAI